VKDPLGLAKALALLVPAALLAGAYGSQYWGGLHPCQLCWCQRYAHFGALAFAMLALLASRLPDRGRSLVWLAALAIAASGATAFYHAGVELKYFEGFTQCTSHSAGQTVEELLESVMAAPLVRCDQVQWSFLGISMAGWNAILSLGSALVILWLSLKRPRTA
jgi:disulfide bond formation protein DsbB